MRLTLAMADAPRYLVTLGDTRHVPENPDGLRTIPLARPDALVTAVRYVQLPQWKEMGVKATHVQLSIGHADLLATLGDEAFAAAAYPRFVEHLNALALEIPTLCEPGAALTIIPITGFEGWEWQGRFNAALSGIIRP